MTVTLHLKPELEAGLLAEAHATGLTVEALILAAVESAILPSPAQSPLERATAFEAWSSGHRMTPPLSDDFVSREAMYESRDI